MPAGATFGIVESLAKSIAKIDKNSRHLLQLCAIGDQPYNRDELTKL